MLKHLLPWFKVKENHRTGDTAPELALLTEIFKLLGNSANGMLIKAFERQTKVSFTKDKFKVHKALRCIWLHDLKEIDNAHEIEEKKQKIIITWPIQFRIVV